MFFLLGCFYLFFDNAFIVFLFQSFVLISWNNSFSQINRLRIGRMWLFSRPSMNIFLLFWLFRLLLLIFNEIFFLLFFFTFLFLFSLSWGVATFKVAQDFRLSLIFSLYLFTTKNFPTLILTLKKRFWLPNTRVSFSKCNIAKCIQAMITISCRHCFSLIIIKWRKLTILIMSRKFINFIFLKGIITKIGFLKLFFEDSTILIERKFLSSKFTIKLICKACAYMTHKHHIKRHINRCDDNCNKMIYFRRAILWTLFFFILRTVFIFFSS